MALEQGYGASDDAWIYCRRTAVMSPEIVEIGEDSKSFNATNNNNISVNCEDVYVAVGRDDLDVVKWVLELYGSASCRVFLIHIFPPITQVPTPVGMLLRSQMAQGQVRFYNNQESNKRRSFLHKYIRLCNDAKVTVETMLIESNNTAKAILDLIPVLNITRLVMGTRPSPSSRWSRRSNGKGEYVKKNAPEYCEVTIVFEGKSSQLDGSDITHSPASSSQTRKWPHLERSFLDCVCFSGKFD